MVSLGDNLIHMSNRLIDLILRVDHSEVLNAGSSTAKVQNPAEEMMKVSKELLAFGFDSDTGKLDYSRLRESEIYKRFRRISQNLPRCTRDELGTGDKLTAFWINIYNALIIDGIIHYDMHGSLISDPGFFRQAAYNIGGMRLSADAIEHGLLRGNRPHPILPIPVLTSADPRNGLYQQTFDPRIHFALVCGANSCPLITFYEADRLEEQLELAARAFINGSAVRFDDRAGTLWLSKIFKWYQEDFGGRDGVLETVRAHLEQDDLSEILSTGDFKLRYMDYDWSVNRLR